MKLCPRLPLKGRISQQTASKKSPVSQNSKQNSHALLPPFIIFTVYPPRPLVHFLQEIFDLSIFIPRPNFCKGVKFASAMTTAESAPESPYLELILPAQGPETIREIQQSVVESAEGWWLGAFSLAGVELDHTGQPDHTVLAQSQVYGEFAELGAAFQSSKYRDPCVKRALLVVNTSYNEYSARLHVMRMRDILCSQSPGLLVGNTTPFPPCDPSHLGIAGAVSLFPFVRGVSYQQPSLGPSNHVNSASGSSTLETVKTRKKKKPAEPSPVGDNTSPALTGPSSEQSALESLVNYRLDSSNPFAAFDATLRNSGQSVALRPPVYLQAFALSPWNPPPHYYRLRGHFLYLAMTTLENESYQVTCHTEGFYVNNCTNAQFDPTHSKVKTSQHGNFARSLTELICSLSPAFVLRLTEIWNRSLSPEFPDFFASLAVTNCLPAFPWLVDSEHHEPDVMRSQLAFLITGSTTAETLPPARDWADEFAQTRELPKNTFAERTLRERIWSRLQSDFALAAARGVISCSRGEVPALNPQEPEPAWTYVLNNILFSRAEDPVGAYEHLGGTPAARAIASKDLMNVRHLNSLDVPGIYTMGSAVVDYHGKRWIAQGMIPGIFRPPDLEAQSAANGCGVSGTDGATDEERGEPGWETVANNDKGSRAPLDTVPGSISLPTTYDILYGSADIEKPEIGLRSDSTFHKLAAGVAAGFSLAEHSVRDLNGKDHKLWLSADVHGVRATDGRCYLIDLYRMAPVDIVFVENDLHGPILDGTENCLHENGVGSLYPHSFTLVRIEAVAAFKQHKFRQFALRHIRKRQEQQQAGQSLEASSEPEAAAADDAGPPQKGLPAESIASKDVSGSIEDEAFELGLNPDAFVSRKKQPWEVPHDQEDQSMTTVRELSKFVREQLLSNVVQDLSEVKGLPADGRRLSDLVHLHGVNIRYLGHIAHRLRLALPRATGASATDDQGVVLQASIEMLHSEMAFRACKHILNKMLEETSEAEACFCISHFLNCLLSPSNVVAPSQSTATKVNSWSLCTSESLHTEITAEVRCRFRYALPASYFTQRLPRTRVQMLRELCTRMGIQLRLRNYQLGQPAPGNVTNGPVPHSTDDEISGEGNTTLSEPTAPSTSNKSKRKKKSKTKKSTSSAAHLDQVFSPDDVLNLLPLVRDSTCRSAVADELYAEGRKAFAAGDIALGQELCTDALTTYEQVFGSVHPEMCRHWHSLAVLYHQLSQRALLELSEYNDKLQELSLIYQATRNDGDREQIKQRIEQFQKGKEPEAAKNEIDTYIQLAAHNLQQSVIVAERTLGLDHPETIQQYSDLSVMEYHLGNTDVAMRYTKHALDLWRVVYGPGCHPDASASVTHAGVLAQSAPHPSRSSRSESIFELSQTLIGSFFGKESAKFAEATLIVSQILVQSGQKELAIKYGDDAVKLLTNRLGPDHEQTKHAQFLRDTIGRSVEAQNKGDEEKSARLARRLGLDPKRAASLRARLMAPSSTPSASTRKESVVNDQLPPAEVPRTPPPTQDGRAATIDELVRYIQGSPVKSTSAKVAASVRQPGSVVKSVRPL